MNKTMYDIKCSFNGKPVIKTIPGYTFVFCGLRFGVSAYYYSGEALRKGSIWRITELQSGLLINIDGAENNTRKAAIDALVKISTSPYFCDLKRRIAEYTACNGALNTDQEPNSVIYAAKNYKRPAVPVYTETAATKALKALKNIQDAGELKRYKLSLTDYQAACIAANELVKAGKTETFISAVSAFFEKHGCKVATHGVNYVITA
jgi:Xaa-Pro aminopeptidase